jgi:hypothetical protein
MNRTREVIPPSLDHALMATRVLAVLNQLENPRPSPLIEGAMEDAVRFLRNIIKGKEFTDKLRVAVAENSYECALAYGEAIRAVDLLPAPAGTQANADRVMIFVRECLKSAEAISQKRPIDQAAVKELNMFFKFVREVSLRVDRKPIEMVSVSG